MQDWQKARCPIKSRKRRDWLAIIWLETSKSRIQHPREGDWEMKAIIRLSYSCNRWGNFIACGSLLYLAVKIVIYEAGVEIWSHSLIWDYSIALVWHFSSTCSQCLLCRTCPQCLLCRTCPTRWHDCEVRIEESLVDVEEDPKACGVESATTALDCHR